MSDSFLIYLTKRGYTVKENPLSISASGKTLTALKKDIETFIYDNFSASDSEGETSKVSTTKKTIYKNAKTSGKKTVEKKKKESSESDSFTISTESSNGQSNEGDSESSSFSIPSSSSEEDVKSKKKVVKKEVSGSASSSSSSTEEDVKPKKKVIKRKAPTPSSSSSSEEDVKPKKAIKKEENDLTPLTKEEVRVGNKVSFISPDMTRKNGTVTKKNPKNAIVETDDGGNFSVAYSSLLKHFEGKPTEYKTPTFKIGDKVKFTSKDGKTIHGSVIKINLKSIKIFTDKDEKWKVSILALTKV